MAVAEKKPWCSFNMKYRTLSHINLKDCIKQISKALSYS